MAPVIKALEEAPGVEAGVCVTAQHRSMLDQVLGLFHVSPDYDLDIMRENQDLAHITQAVLTRMMDVLEDFKPDRVLVHGDTTTTFATSTKSATAFATSSRSCCNSCGCSWFDTIFFF